MPLPHSPDTYAAANARHTTATAALTGHGWDASWIEAVLSVTEAGNVTEATRAHFQFSPLPVALCSAARTAGAARVLLVNPAFTKLTGIAARDIVGQSAMHLAGAEPDAIHLAEIELLHSHPEQMPFGIVTAKKRPDGSWYHVEEHIVPLRGGEREPAYYLVAQVELVTPPARKSTRKVA